MAAEPEPDRFLRLALADRAGLSLSEPSIDKLRCPNRHQTTAAIDWRGMSLNRRHHIRRNGPLRPCRINSVAQLRVTNSRGGQQRQNHRVSNSSLPPSSDKSRGLVGSSGGAIPLKYARAIVVPILRSSPEAESLDQSTAIAAKIVTAPTAFSCCGHTDEPMRQREKDAAPENVAPTKQTRATRKNRTSFRGHWSID